MWFIGDLKKKTLPRRKTSSAPCLQFLLTAVSPQSVWPVKRRRSTMLRASEDTQHVFCMTAAPANASHFHLFRNDVWCHIVPNWQPLTARWQMQLQSSPGRISAEEWPGLSHTSTIMRLHRKMGGKSFNAPPPLPSLLTHFHFDTETARAAEQSRGRQRSGCGGTCTLQGVCMHEPDLTLDDLLWDVLSFYWRLQHPQNDEYPAEPCSCWELLCVERWQQLPIPGIGGETENAALFLCTSTWNPFNLSRLCINRIRSEV